MGIEVRGREPCWPHMQVRRIRAQAPNRTADRQPNERYRDDDGGGFQIALPCPSASFSAQLLQWYLSLSLAMVECLGVCSSVQRPAWRHDPAVCLPCWCVPSGAACAPSCPCCPLVTCPHLQPHIMRYLQQAIHSSSPFLLTFSRLHSLLAQSLSPTSPPRRLTTSPPHRPHRHDMTWLPALSSLYYVQRCMSN
jgi:hypothetical protein